MGAQRFTLSFGGAIAATTAKQTFNIPSRMRTLIPKQLENEKFLMKVSFQTTGNNLVSLAYLVSIEMSSNYNSSTTSSLVCGFANPVTVGSPNYIYKMTELECVPQMVDYPKDDSINFSIQVIGVAPTVGSWYANITYELI